MTTQCQHCGSSNTQKRGTRTHADGAVVSRVYCKDCAKFFTIPVSEFIDEESEGIVKSDLNFVRDREYIEGLQTYKRFVITAAVNNSNVDKEFFAALNLYCAAENAALIVIPIMYRNVSLFENGDEYWFAPELVPYLVENNFDIAHNVRILGGLKTQATAVNPLSGIDSVSKGKTVIIGHTQVALKTLPRLNEIYPPIATTTGAITEENYSDTKVGYIANFNHSMSACVVELDGDEHFIRHLNFDGSGFYDFDRYYSSDNVMECREVDALIMGDLHFAFRDEGVEKATFTNDDSICNTLMPKNIFFGDSLDFHSSNHHSRSNIFSAYARFLSGTNCVKSELDATLAYLQDITPDYATGYVIASNHNDALKRWLNEIEIKREVHNALIYHLLMYKMLEQTKMTENGATSPDPFALYAEHIGVKENIRFLKRNQSFKIHDIELSLHGDVASNGSRSGPNSFANMNSKFVTGHSHSPSINKGSYIVGTSSKFRLDYNQNGPSSWDHAHVMIYPNGKKQMVFIRNGKWRS